MSHICCIQDFVEKLFLVHRIINENNFKSDCCAISFCNPDSGVVLIRIEYKYFEGTSQVLLSASVIKVPIDNVNPERGYINQVKVGVSGSRNRKFEMVCYLDSGIDDILNGVVWRPNLTTTKKYNFKKF